MHNKRISHSKRIYFFFSILRQLIESIESIVPSLYFSTFYERKSNLDQTKLLLVHLSFLLLIRSLGFSFVPKVICSWQNTSFPQQDEENDEKAISNWKICVLDFYDCYILHSVVGLSYSKMALFFCKSLFLDIREREL